MTVYRDRESRERQYPSLASSSYEDSQAPHRHSSHNSKQSRRIDADYYNSYPRGDKQHDSSRKSRQSSDKHSSRRRDRESEPHKGSREAEKSRYQPEKDRTEAGYDSREADRERQKRHRRSRSRSPSRGRRRDDRPSRDLSPQNHKRDTSRFEQKTGLSLSALAQMQQEAMQRQMVTQQLAQQMSQNTSTASNLSKKLRQIYVGNLYIGVVNEQTIRELFNAAMAHMVPNPVSNPPVIGVNLDPSGRFGFVELRTDEIATEALKLDKTQICGRCINVGRPKGYVEPSRTAVAAAQYLQTGNLLASHRTAYVMFDNVLTCGELRAREDRQDLEDEFLEQCGECCGGQVEAVVVPEPGVQQMDTEPGRVYLQAASPDAAKLVHDTMSHRTLQNKRITCTYVLQEEFQLVQTTNKWVDKVSRTQLMHKIVAADPTASGTLAAGGGAGGGDLPGRSEGIVRCRGIAGDIKKSDLVQFFVGCGAVRECHVWIVLQTDGQPAREAFVEFVGEGADYQGALKRDKQKLPTGDRYIDLFPSNREEMEHRVMSGLQLV